MVDGPNVGPVGEVRVFQLKNAASSLRKRKTRVIGDEGGSSYRWVNNAFGKNNCSTICPTRGKLSDFATLADHFDAHPEVGSFVRRIRFVFTLLGPFETPSSRRRSQAF